MVAPGQCDDLMFIGPDHRAGTPCAHLLDGRPGLLNQPREVARLGDMLRSAGPEPAHAVPAASRKDVGHLQVLAEPVEASIYLVLEPGIGRKAGGGAENAFLGARVNAAPRRHETDIHGEHYVSARSPGSEGARIAGGMATGVAQVTRVPCFDMRSSILTGPFTFTGCSINRVVGNGPLRRTFRMAAPVGDEAR